MIKNDLGHFSNIEHEIDSLSLSDLKSFAKQYKLLADSTRNVIVIHKNAKIVYTNRAVNTIFGYQPDEIIGKPIEIFIDPSVQDVFNESIIENHDVFETLGVDQNDKTIILEVENNPLPIEFEQAYYVLIFKDITRRKNVENKLFRTEREYKKLFEDSKDAIYISSKEGKILDCNKAALELFQFTKEEALHLDTKNLYANPETRNNFISEIEKFGAVRDYEVNLVRKNGEVVDCLISSSVRIDREGNVIGYQGIIRDITNIKKNAELRKAKELAEKTAEHKSRFLANMSHEIRTPLNAIFGLTNLLLSSELSDKQYHYVNVIKSSTDHLLVLINDILDLSKIDAGKLNIEQIEFSLKDLLENLESAALFKVNQKGLTFKINVNKYVPDYLIGDPVRLNQILFNLVSNALKFTIEGNVDVNVRILEEKEHFINLYFEVKDTGIGIPKAYQKVIFESFTQGNYDTTRKFGGTGLGLAITKKLVEMQGGKISVKSKESEGSVFSFSLNFTKSSGEQYERKKELEKRADIWDLGNLKILLVEDNKVNQFVTSETIKNWGTGIEIDIAENGLIGVNMFSNKNYDLIIMDIQMPVMDGYTATEKIRETLPEPKNKVPILAMTAFATPGEASKCLKVGMNDYIPKPFNPRNLFRKIAELTNRQSGNVLRNKAKDINPAKDGKISDTDLINLKYLDTVTSGNKELRKNMIQIILDETPGEMQRINQFCKNEEWYALGAAAHKIKSTATFIGNRFLEKELKSLELDAKAENDTNTFVSRIQQIDNTFNKALLELKNMSG
jgi:PAS domain S-box-containing protein